MWDIDMSVATVRQCLRRPDPVVRAYYVGKLMRQAKPDDVFSFVTVAEIRRLWPQVTPYLGQTRPFWEWLLARWEP